MLFLKLWNIVLALTFIKYWLTGGQPIWKTLKNDAEYYIISIPTIYKQLCQKLYVFCQKCCPSRKCKRSFYIISQFVHSYIESSIKNSYSINVVNSETWQDSFLKQERRKYRVLTVDEYNIKYILIGYI